MLSNLIVNAIRYSPEKSRIHITSFLIPTDLLILISPALERKLMSLKNSSVDFGGDNSCYSVGQGLGLSLVKAIAELHGKGHVSLSQ
ncbi:ATP-binding protein [Escherichia coli]